MGVPWTPNAPQFPESWSESGQPVVIRTQQEVGPPKVRRRSTSVFRTVQLTFVGTHDQWLALQNFYEIDLQGGVLFHNFLHPYDLQTYEFRFTEPPQVSNINALGTQVSCVWERLI